MPIFSSLSRYKLGFLVRKYRTKKNFTQKQLAEYLNIHPNYLGCIERGEKNISLVMTDYIIKKLGVSEIEAGRIFFKIT
jgi:XRE family transcriptional regulator, regulator of sulfur utilization